MAIKLVGKEWCPCVDSYKCDYIVDTESDIANLPDSCTGSSALVVETANVYMVNASDQWVVFGGK